MAKEGTILMSFKERDSFLVLERVKKGEMSLREGSEVLGVSYRQVCRRYVRYREKGAAGLTHRLRGKRGNRRMAADTEALVIDLYRSIYDGFGPVLYAEKLLSEHEIKVDHETVRRLLIRKGLWRVKRRRKSQHRPWRERRAHFGELVQLDGSHHKWFEDRGAECCLMVMIDDATGTRMSLMADGETTEAAMRLLWMWIERYGIPVSLYTDKKNVYVPSEKARDKARIEGREALTQFSRACSKLGIEIVPAHSPQAKGRVERSNGVYQDRLVKEMRLKDTNDIAGANSLLQNEGFDQELNRRFAVEAREKADYHRSALDYDLSAVFCIEEERTLSVNWTLSFQASVYRIAQGSENYSPAKTKVQIRRYLDGSLHIFYRGREVEFEEIDPRRAKTKSASSNRQPKPSVGTRKPMEPDNPWGRFVISKREIRPFF